MVARPWDTGLGVLMYGSMLQKDRLRDVFGDVDDRLVPVDVDGFARIDATADRRETDGDERGVLNAHKDPDVWLNAVLVTDVEPAEYGRYVHRETGYRFLRLEDDVITARGRRHGLPDEIVIAADAPADPTSTRSRPTAGPASRRPVHAGSGSTRTSSRPHGWPMVGPWGRSSRNDPTGDCASDAWRRHSWTVTFPDSSRRCPMASILSA